MPSRPAVREPSRWEPYRHALRSWSRGQPRIRVWCQQGCRQRAAQSCSRLQSGRRRGQRSARSPGGSSRRGPGSCDRRARGCSSPTAPAIRRRAGSPRCWRVRAMRSRACVSPGNRFTRRYRMEDQSPTDHDEGGLGLRVVHADAPSSLRRARWLRRGLFHVRRGRRPLLAGAHGRLRGRLRAHRLL